MKKIILFIGVLVIVGTWWSSCGQQPTKQPLSSTQTIWSSNEKNTQDVPRGINDTLQHAKYPGDSLEKPSLRYIPHYPIQKDTSSFHRFADLTLKKDKLTGAYYVKNIGGYGIEGVAYYERYPGILNKRVHQGNKPTEVIFYDETRTKIVKRVNLKSLNPYLNKYRNIKHAYPIFELYEAPPENEREYYMNAIPDTFLTFYTGGMTAMNGFTVTVYTLVPVKENKILGWESTAVVLDREGNVLGEIKEDNQIGSVALSDDGKLVAYTYGKYPDNPYDKAPDGEVRIINIRSSNVLLEKKPCQSCAIGIFVDYSTLGEFILISEGSKISPIKNWEVDLVNLNTRERYYYNFKIEEFRKAWRKCGSYVELIGCYPFTKTNF